MTIEGIKAKKVGAGPESAYVAEAEVKDGYDETVFVTLQMYDGEECTVSRESVFAFLAEDKGEPVTEFLEEYEDLDTAIEESDYGDIFEELANAIDALE